MDIVLNQTHH